MNKETLMRIPSGTTVLVTGASGFTGKVLVRRLAEMGVRIRAIARPSSDVSALADIPIEWFRGQVYDANIVEQAVSGVEYIFHVAAALRDAGMEDEEYRRVHLYSTQFLANGALKQPDFKRFIHVSTIGVHGDVEDQIASEDFRFKPGDIYQETKLEAENWIRDFSVENNLPFSIIRPAAIYGPGDRRLLKFFRMAKYGWCFLLDHHDTRYHLIHVSDLVQGILLCATHPNALEQTFICGNRVHYSIREIAAVAGDELGRRVRCISLPSKPFFWLADICEKICSIFEWKPPIYRRRVAFFTKDRSFDTTKIHNMLGFEETFENEAGIRMTAAWYRDNGWL